MPIRLNQVACLDLPISYCLHPQVADQVDRNPACRALSQHLVYFSGASQDRTLAVPDAVVRQHCADRTWRESVEQRVEVRNGLAAGELIGVAGR